jgi:hypothetical protein
MKEMRIDLASSCFHANNNCPCKAVGSGSGELRVINLYVFSLLEPSSLGVIRLATLLCGSVSMLYAVELL